MAHPVTFRADIGLRNSILSGREGYGGQGQNRQGDRASEGGRKAREVSTGTLRGGGTYTSAQVLCGAPIQAQRAHMGVRNRILQGGEVAGRRGEGTE